jgi:hypothetical protein
MTIIQHSVTENLCKCDGQLNDRGHLFDVEIEMSGAQLWVMTSTKKQEDFYTNE